MATKIQDIIKGFVASNRPNGEWKLAEKAKCSPKTVERAKAGKVRKPTTIYELAIAAGCSPADAEAAVSAAAIEQVRKSA
jgi:hypothetical protein